MTAHIAVLSNPHSGKGRGRAAADAAAAHLRASGADVREYAGRSAAETRALAQQALAARPLALVVVGGDGTLSGILDIVAAGTVPIALVPAGTGNDFARALDLPRHSATDAADLALHGRSRAVDVGEVTSAGRTSLFLTVAALGFDARVSDRTNRLRWPRGGARYYLALLIELARLQPMTFTVTCDGSAPKIAPGTLVAVGNTASYGGGMPVAAGALPDDARLDIVHVAPLGRLRLLMLFPLLLKGRHLGRAEVMHRRVRRVTVSAPELVVYADGERVGEDECTIRVRPGALQIMVPADGKVFS